MCVCVWEEGLPSTVDIFAKHELTLSCYLTICCGGNNETSNQNVHVHKIVYNFSFFRCVWCVHRIDIIASSIMTIWFRLFFHIKCETLELFSQIKLFGHRAFCWTSKRNDGNWKRWKRIRGKGAKGGYNVEEWMTKESIKRWAINFTRNIMFACIQCSLYCFCCFELLCGAILDFNFYYSVRSRARASVRPW